MADRAAKKGSRRTTIAVVLAPLACLVCLPSLLVRLTPCTTAHHEPSCTIDAGLKLNPQFWLENIDDPLPSAAFIPDDPGRVDKWYWRNPFHNFTFYVIGLADLRFERIGLCPRDNFNRQEGWNWCVARYGFLEVPFISFKNGRLQAYFGWRERGNFGIKFNL